MELVHMMDRGSYGTINSIKTNIIDWNVSSYDSTEKHFERVIKYLEFISKGLNATQVALGTKAEVIFSKEHLRALCQLFMILEGNRQDSYDKLAKLTLDNKDKFFGDSRELQFNISQIERKTEFIETFVTWHDGMCDPDITPKQFARTPDGKVTKDALPGGYFWSVGVSGPEGVKARENGLIEFVTKEWLTMRKNGTISSMKEVRGKKLLPSKLAIAIRTNFKNPFACENIQVITSLDKHEKDHTPSLKFGGRSSVDSMNLTTQGANRAKGAK